MEEILLQILKGYFKIAYNYDIYIVYKWQIGDLRLSQSANNTSSNNEIYGVISYIAPEVFNCSSFTKASDVYAMAMNLQLIIDGKRPEISTDTTDCFADFMKQCWDFDSSNRSSIKGIRETVSSWRFEKINVIQFNQAEKKTIGIIKIKET
ncbi:17050_t:CDS:2 [Funneliformis geosporum]|uniref:12158_t:CDS:1 n=1 Tax=Funneliformis geosporum TaxID=1117311 RepID=A0A9W4WHM1_9GLOM|nr:17050_t:CDS:2 [Funneliformis geosporum]CAI2162382.1 12158_t:CDS:2 [Funneliformis geosporum]